MTVKNVFTVNWLDHHAAIAVSTSFAFYLSLFCVFNLSYLICTFSAFSDHADDMIMDFRTLPS